MTIDENLEAGRLAGTILDLEQERQDEADARVVFPDDVLPGVGDPELSLKDAVTKIGGRGAAMAEITRRAGDRRRRPQFAALLGQRAAGPDHGGTGGGRQAMDERSS